MTQLTVAFFNCGIKAARAVRKLRDLELYGIVTVYDTIMIHKKAGGGYEIIKENITVDYTVLTAMLVGGLLGALAGPVGFVAGVFAGSTVGTVEDANHYNFDLDFIGVLVEKMADDTVSLIVETDELTEEFMDVYLRSFDAVVLKTLVDYNSNNLFTAEMKENQQAIETAAMELKKGKNRQQIQADLGVLKTARKKMFAAFEMTDRGLAVADILL